MLRRPVVKRRGLNGHSFLILPEMTTGAHVFASPPSPRAAPTAMAALSGSVRLIPAIGRGAPMSSERSPCRWSY